MAPRCTLIYMHTHMKHIIYICMAALTVVLSACSNIEPNERLVEIEAIPEALIQRNVLIEDFTGQNCPNCPDATEAIEALEEVYGHHVIGVGLHCGNLGMGTPLYTQEAQDIFLQLGNPDLAQPSVRVGRTGNVYTGGPVIKSNLPALVMQQLMTATPISIYNLSTTKVADTEDDYLVEVLVKSTTDANVKVHAWVLEDNVVSKQSVGGVINRQYVHNAVFRKALTDVKGDDLELTSGNAKVVSLSLTKGSKWKEEDLSVVVFATDSKGEVLQVEKFPFQEPIAE